MERYRGFATELAGLAPDVIMSNTTPAVAALQKRAYRDLAPLVLALPPDRAFARAEAAARALGWHIVAAAPAEGRLEASDTTLWFGFTDDIVVRVRPRAAASTCDPPRAWGAATWVSTRAAYAPSWPPSPDRARVSGREPGTLLQASMNI